MLLKNFLFISHIFIEIKNIVKFKNKKIYKDFFKFLKKTKKCFFFLNMLHLTCIQILLHL